MVLRVELTTLVTIFWLFFRMCTISTRPLLDSPRSHHLKDVSKTSSVKLLHLLQAFSVPKLLLSEERNSICLRKILTILENIILHQPTENANLIYEMMTRRELLFKLNKSALRRRRSMSQQRSMTQPLDVSGVFVISDENEVECNELIIE
eukprot:TRINITY_DN13908_c0_g1_i1.p1 TRINITY_DN13908_c0_g1~~TRINITY_DN13908_c0_g1_i1.p1  ORF type:complete len:150 (-),score=20.53 TRINITY_DN13908_c0_g1_i1:457-906(-)